MRRVILIALVGALLIAGCASNPTNGNQSTTGNSSMANANSTANATSTSNASAAPKPKFTIRTEDSGKQVTVVDMGGDRVTNNSTKKVVVTVNDKPATVWVSDEKSDNATGTYPLSIGNKVTVNATAGDTVAVVWYPQDGQKQTLVSQKVKAPETTTTTSSSSTNSSTNASTTANTSTTTNATTTTKTSTSG